MPDSSLRTQRLDDLDRQLIALLRVDARAPLADLARRLQVSRGTVQNRLDKLMNNGVVQGFTVRVVDNAAPDAVRAIMLIEITGKTTTDVIRKLRGIPQLTRLHTTNGSWDLIAEVEAANLDDFDQTLRAVRAIAGIKNSETSILLTTV